MSQYDHVTIKILKMKRVSYIKQAIRIGPDYADAHYNLGVNYSLGFNDRDSALEQYKILYYLDTELAKELLDLIYIEE